MNAKKMPMTVKNDAGWRCFVRSNPGFDKQNSDAGWRKMTFLGQDSIGPSFIHGACLATRLRAPTRNYAKQLFGTQMVRLTLTILSKGRRIREEPSKLTVNSMLLKTATNPNLQI
jgi:hypothetical protein